MKKFFSAVSNIPNKNNGGCLFFCYAFWRYLVENNLPKDGFLIIQHDYSDKHYTQHNEKFIIGKADHAQSSKHFTWMYNNEEYDGNGIVEEHEEGFPRTPLNGLQNDYENLVDKFCVSALNYGCWNTMFDRNYAIEVIKQKLNLDLSNVAF